MCEKSVFAMLISNMKTCQNGSDIYDDYAVYVVFACFLSLKAYFFSCHFLLCNDVVGNKRGGERLPLLICYTKI